MSIVTYSNESGDSKEHAVKIVGAENERDGVQAEYRYLNQQFGEQGKTWILECQSLIFDKDSGRVYDRMDIEFHYRKVKTIYFDITEFYGKF